jgi:hypothetical protein
MRDTRFAVGIAPHESVIAPGGQNRAAASKDVSAMALQGINQIVADRTVPAAARKFMPKLGGFSLRAEAAEARSLKLGFFAVWLCLVVLLVAQHAFWRDEVRALSLALSGSNVIAMFRAIQGEGHPAVWYVLLRATHAVTGSALTLPIVSVSVAAAAMLLLVLLAPFAWWFVALLLFGNFALFEYSVVARNYGISALLLFLLAEFYPRHRTRGALLGCLLFGLENTNVHCVVLAGAFLLFWLTDLLMEQGLRWTPALRGFCVNALIVAIGAAVCFVTVYPPVNDGAAIDLHAVTLRSLAAAVVLPGGNFGELLLDLPRRALALAPMLYPATLVATSALLFGAVIGLIRLPGASLAALAGLTAFSLFFVVVYPGSYRHEGLWLFFVIALYWIMLARADTPAPFARGARFLAPLSSIGTVCLVTLIVLQIPRGVYAASSLAVHSKPLSRSRELATFITSQPALHQATLLADPDFMLEAMPYYVPNRLYFLHEQRFGSVVKFTMHARLSVSLADMLAAAQKIQAETQQPVLMLLTHPIDPAAPAQSYTDGYHWDFSATPQDVRAFLQAAHKVAGFAPAVTDESYEVYQLN